MEFLVVSFKVLGVTFLDSKYVLEPLALLLELLNLLFVFENFLGHFLDHGLVL